MQIGLEELQLEDRIFTLILYTPRRWFRVPGRKLLNNLFTPSHHWAMGFGDIDVEEFFRERKRCVYETILAAGPREKRREEFMLPSCVLSARPNRHLCLVT